MADEPKGTEVAAPKVNAREAWGAFETDIQARASEIASQLPSNVSRERFINATIAAVKATPDLLLATPRSLMSAVVKAAQDGLLPDGREGIITIYEQKVRNSNPERKEMVAQWNPMFAGIRKRARELDGIIIDAQVVVDGDDFEFELGDNPFIKHKPAVRAEAVEAAKGVAAYAIFRHPTDGILHREVMWKPEVFATMNQSRAKGSLMWTVFWTEGWKKACGRRGSKSVPMSAPLQQIIQRDDENFAFDRPPAVATRPAMPEIPDAPAAPAITQQTQVPMQTVATKEPEKITEKITAPEIVHEERKADQAATPEVEEPEVEEPDPWGDATRLVATVAPNFDAVKEGDTADLVDTSDEGRELATVDGLLATARDLETLDRLWKQSDAQVTFADDPDNLSRAAELYAKHKARIERADLEAAGQGSMFPGDR